MYNHEDLLTESNHFLFFKLNQSIERVPDPKIKKQLTTIRELMLITSYAFLNNKKAARRRFGQSFVFSFKAMLPFLLLTLGSQLLFPSVKLLIISIIALMFFALFSFEDIKNKVEKKQIEQYNKLVDRMFNDYIQVSRKHEP